MAKSYEVIWELYLKLNRFTYKSTVIVLYEISRRSVYSWELYFHYKNSQQRDKQKLSHEVILSRSL